MRIFKNTWFTRFAGKEGITDAELKEEVIRLEAGQADADLGGGVYKLRVARYGRGKAGAYRVIVFFKARSGRFLFMVLLNPIWVTLAISSLEISKERQKLYLP